MTSPQFTAARILLTPTQVAKLDAQLTAWKSLTPSSPWFHTASNIENETALEAGLFAKLLTDFIDHLPNPDAWSTACRKNHFAGPFVPNKFIPVALGRLVPFEKLYSYIEAVPSLSISEFKQLLLEADGKDLGEVDQELLDTLHTMELGKFLMWSTFDKHDSSRDPFDLFDQNALDCCTRLGLHDPKGATCILLTYHSAPYRRTAPKLRFNRPTVADAGGFELYRPHPDPAQFHGMTHPTEPNPKTLPACPEIVHKPIFGHGLAFSIRVAV